MGYEKGNALLSKASSLTDFKKGAWSEKAFDIR
jgi:hypothetical protein